jgi:phospholipase C
MGFVFDRSGVRIPTLAVSAWIPERTVITDEYRATSLIATMRERWRLGAPLTARDASARSFSEIFTASAARDQSEWPEVVPRPVPTGPDSFLPQDAPLGLLGKSLIAGVFALAQGLQAEVPKIEPDTVITGREAMAAVQDVLVELFPRLQEVPRPS